MSSRTSAFKYVEGSKKVFLQTGTRFQREIIGAVATIKQAAAMANVSLGLLDKGIGEAIQRAAKETASGLYDDQVVVDVFQTGSGTGINMNLNEVIAARSSELAGVKVHPNDHINMGQSSNDVVPTAIRIAAVGKAEQALIPALDAIINSLDRLAESGNRVYKAGRTHLRDALPVTMGQEFKAYADAFRINKESVASTLKMVKELPIGGTAVGTGINTDPRFGNLVIKSINLIMKTDFRESSNKSRAMKLLTDILSLSDTMTNAAINLLRLCQDLRLMFSGPITGLGEIDIPTQEEVAGSSIMPGKTNPVTVEASMLAMAQVLGLGRSIEIASTFGEFELSMGVPLVGYDVVAQEELLSEALYKIAEVVLSNIVFNKERAMKYAEGSPSLITVISPLIGYDRASAIGKELVKGSSIREALKSLGYTYKEIDGILDMKKLVEGGLIKPSPSEERPRPSGSRQPAHRRP